MNRIVDIAEYMVSFVNEFAQRHSLSDVQAFRYLWQYGAINAIADYYDVAHTLTFDDVCQTALRICASKGGMLE